MTMTSSRYESEFFQNIEAKGIAKGLAEAIFDVLEPRDVPVSEEVRERILACADVDQLQVWVRRVGTVNSAEQLFS